jgi:SNF2 family DNA or RNA helicase
MPRKLPHLLLPTTDSTKEPSPHLKKQFVLLSQIDDTVYFLSLCVFATMMNVQQPPAQEAPRRSVLGDVNPNTVRPATSHSDKHSATSTNKTTSVVLAASTTITPNSDPPAELPVPPEDPNSILEQEALAMDWKEAQKSVDYLFDDCLKTQFKGVPKIAMPKILQKNGLQLFPHQVDAIRWLTHREKTNSDAPPFFAERKFGSKVYWSDKIQSGRVNYDEKPEPVKGSVLADEYVSSALSSVTLSTISSRKFSHSSFVCCSCCLVFWNNRNRMGLGKTLQTIGLILSSRPTGVRSYPIKNDLPLDTPRCTLIVAPVSVMATWAQEFEKYVNKNSEVLKIDFYQGYKRHRALDKVKSGSLDVLIVSYETLAADLKKSRKASRSTQSQRNEDDTEDTEEDEDGSIFDLMFHRFVLDEAHLVRNATTKAFRACKGIQSTHTLALTGTPFINNPMDIQSLFAILKVHPLSEKDVFNDYIQQPILDRKEIGLSKLRLALASVCLRRTKDGTYRV